MPMDVGAKELVVGIKKEINSHIPGKDLI